MVQSRLALSSIVVCVVGCSWVLHVKDDLNTNSRMMTLLMLFAIQFATLSTIPTFAYRPRSFHVKSTFIHDTSKQLAINASCKHTNHQICNILTIRGGAYEDYNEGYGYDDGKGYKDDYNYNDYEQEKRPYGTQGSQRYDEDYYPNRSDGYYDDEGRYYEDFDDRDGGRSVSYVEQSIAAAASGLF